MAEITNEPAPKPGDAPQPPLAYPRATLDSDRAKRPALAERLAIEQRRCQPRAPSIKRRLPSPDNQPSARDTGLSVLSRGIGLRLMAKQDSSQSLRNEIEELREEAAALADRAKKTARQAEVLAERIKYLEKQLVKQS
jgi:hypothetical protein